MKVSCVLQSMDTLDVTWWFLGNVSKMRRRKHKLWKVLTKVSMWLSRTIARCFWSRLETKESVNVEDNWITPS